jgi:superfamily I DNA and/or RNA helicase
VIVGDLKQLSHVVDSHTKRLTDSIFNEFKLDEAYRYSANSLLSAAIKLYTHVARTLLREHYRCHPKIIEFCNKKFYNNELLY